MYNINNIYSTDDYNEVIIPKEKYIHYKIT